MTRRIAGHASFRRGSSTAIVVGESLFSVAESAGYPQRVVSTRHVQGAISGRPVERIKSQATPADRLGHGVKFDESRIAPHLEYDKKEVG
jgi:hypothetical protein